MNIRWIWWQLFFQLTALSKQLLIMKYSFEKCGNTAVQSRCDGSQGVADLSSPANTNRGPIFLFSEVEVGGSALFASVIPKRSYTNTIRAMFGSVVHKTEKQKLRSISERHSAILWATALFRRESMPTAKVKTYPQGCGLLCWKIICEPPEVLDLQSQLGQTKYPAPTESSCHQPPLKKKKK